MHQFILFGDSITQQSFSPDNHIGYLGPTLSDAYVRRLDVINRGFSGYNTTQALQVLPRFMPSPQHAQVTFMTIFFGANDARLPNTPGGPDQHVPLEQFKSHLRQIATHSCVQAHKDIRIVFVTPPPVDERKLIETDRVKYPGNGSMLRRTAKTTAKYAQAVRELGEELHLPVLDIWRTMIRRARYAVDNLDYDMLPGSKDAPECKILHEFLHDGLHFSRSAYEVLYEELMAVIERTWPEHIPDRLPFVFPRWDDEDVWKGEKLIESRTML